MAKIKKNPLKIVSNLESYQIKIINNWIGPHDDDKNVDWKRSTPWKVTSEGVRGFVILRCIRFKDSSQTRERFDRSLYDFQKDKGDKCEEVCRVLNYRLKSKLDAREAWMIRSDFIKVQGSELSQKFKAYIFARSANEKHSQKCVRLLSYTF